jgi:TrmH family RNA methyltransferase
MIYPDSIFSIENKHIKNIKKILKSPRNYPEFLIVEGEKHAYEFKNSLNFRLVRWFILEEKAAFFSWINFQDITLISKNVLSYLSDVDCSQGIIGLFVCGYSLNKDFIDYGQETFILDRVSDPGNVGALIRTAVALNRKCLILVDGVFPFCPKVVRASAGMISYIKIYRITLEEMIDVLFFKNINIMKMSMDGEAMLLKNIDALRKYFILLGNEGCGIREEFNVFINKNLSLPMSDKVESLNVAIAGSIMGYLMWGNIA